MNKQMVKARARRASGGFSLLELLVVLAILGLLVGVVGPRVMGYLGKAKSQTAGVQIQNVKTALDVFFLDTGRYPTEDEGLQVLVSNPQGIPGWSGPYMQDGELPLDPWGRTYRYRQTQEGTIKVYSYGADDAEGGSGDNADIGL